MLQVAVIGLGRFGSHVTEMLHDSGHEVLAIDRSPSAIQRIKNHSSRAIVTDARDKDQLRALGIKDFDTVIVSLGESIEASALVALHLRELGVPKVIAKAGSTDHARLLEMLGVHEIVFPEHQAAERLAHRLRYANVLDYIPLSGEHSIHEITPPTDFVDKSLADLRLRNRFRVQVLAIRNTQTDQLEVIPDPQYHITKSDVLVVLGSNADLEKLRKLKRSD